TITTLFDTSADIFGSYWQLLLLGNFFIGVFLACSKYGNVRLGNQAKPKYSYYRWVAMILCTLLASGGVFWAAAEPMYHYMDTPPLLGGGAFDNVDGAFAHSFMHWGFTAWAILGTLATIVMMYVHYTKGMPLRPRGLLYPILDRKSTRLNSSHVSISYAVFFYTCNVFSFPTRRSSDLYMDTPPLLGGGAFDNVDGAFAHSFMHWGFTAWAILGTLATIVMMYVHYTKGMPLRPRGLLYPIFGEKIYEKSVLGSAADVISIIATVAGTLGPLGFLGLQISY